MDENKLRDSTWRSWYDKNGRMNEASAYEVWCAAWAEATWQATKPKVCLCENPMLCNLYDRCCKVSRED